MVVGRGTTVNWFGEAVIPAWRMQGRFSQLYFLLYLQERYLLPCLRAPTRPRSKKIKAPAAEKQTKWQGHVVRIYADLSQVDIRSDKVGPSEHLLDGMDQRGKARETGRGQGR